MRWRLFTLISITLLSACSAVTIAPGDVSRAEPSLSEQRRFYAFGWVGNHRLRSDDYCAEQDLQQIRAYRSGRDGLLTLLSLGLYAPLTVDIWCAAGEDNA